MKRLFAFLAVACLLGMATVVSAGDFHRGLTLVCSDCHISHYSQSHTMTGGPAASVFPPLGPGGPFNDLLRDEEVKMCLACHDGQSWAPDVFGASATETRRLAGGLNAKAGTITNETGYAEYKGHTLFSTDVPPGYAGTFTPGPEGLVCTSCHAQHGFASYRNLLGRGIFAGDTLTYVTGTNDGTKDVFQRSSTAYSETDVDFNEPSTTSSKYAAWCQNCHQNFHGASGSAEMGGASGGATSSNAFPWKRHPNADVNIGQAGATHISSLSQFNGRTHRVKVMDSQGLWNGTTADNTVTPSCFSCHKAHGTRNAFGLIFINGGVATAPTEDGNGGVYKDLCRQCHTQGADL